MISELSTVVLLVRMVENWRLGKLDRVEFSFSRSS